MSLPDLQELVQLFVHFLVFLLRVPSLVVLHLYVAHFQQRFAYDLSVQEVLQQLHGDLVLLEVAVEYLAEQQVRQVQELERDFDLHVLGVVVDRFVLVLHLALLQNLV